jgi:hypothetical protein
MAVENIVSLDKIISEFANVGAAQAAQGKKLDADEAALNQSVGKEEDAIRREAELTGQVQGLVDELGIRRAGRNADAAASFGTNPDASTYIINELAKTSVENDKRLRASAIDLQQKMSVGPGDDILEWIANQFILPSQAQAHNALAVEQEIVTGAISRLQQQTQEQVKINNAITANTSQAIIKANSERLLAAAAVKAANAQQEALKVNMTVGSVRLATTQQAFTNSLALVRAQVDLQQLQIQRDRNKLDKELKQERLEALRRAEKSDLELQVDLNRATQLHGMRQITPEQFRRMSGPMKQVLEYAMSDPSMLSGRLGPNPAVAVEMAVTINSPLTPATQDVKGKLIDMMVTAQSRPDWSALKPEQKQNAHLKAINERLALEMRNIPDSGSIFSAPPMQSVGKIPRVEATVLWKEYLAPLAKNPTAPMSANQLFTGALDTVAAGKMPIEQAALEISEIYKAIVADNWHNKDYGRFAVQVPEQYRHSYNTRIPGPFRFGTEQPLDMTNATAVKNRMLRHLNAQKMSDEAETLSSQMLP